MKKKLDKKILVSKARTGRFAGLIYFINNWFTDEKNKNTKTT